MISPENDEEFGPFGKSAITLLEALFTNTYRALIVVSPSFGDIGGSNISPQFDRGDFFVLSSIEDLRRSGGFRSSIARFSPSPDIDVVLDRYHYEHAILASIDLSILTAWAQAEYAVIAFRGTLLDEYSEWLESMRSMEVIRQIA